MAGLKSKPVVCPPGTKRCGQWNVPLNWKDWHCELLLFGKSHGERKLAHFKKLVGLLWPEPLFMWDEWADLFFGALCGAKETVERVCGTKLNNLEGKWWEQVPSTGAAATGKSSKAAMWVLCQWLCAQEHTSVVLTSTSLDQLKRRIWAELCEWIGKSVEKLPLEIVPSDTEIRFRKGDKRSAIFGIAVKSGGDSQEAIDRIKGIHNRRVFVVVDEATAVAPAITQAGSNLNKGTIEFQLLLLANAVPGENPHTAYCEPKDGWSSVKVDDQAWATKMGGICCHFDGHRSPALRDPEKFYFYIKQSEMDKDVIQYGGENTPEYWTNDRGFWPPTGLSNTVMDLALLNQFHVSDAALWKGAWEMGAAFDPAFEGGDRRVLYPFKFGEFASGVIGVEFHPPIIVGVDMTQDKRWIHYQISDAVQNLCENYEIDGKKTPIPPKNYIGDVTGEGAAIHGILSGRWSPEIQATEFGGAAEKVAIAPDRPTTYYELYGNKVTMLWYVMRRFIEGDQVRGLSDSETRSELTTREKFMRNGKTVIQPKKDMKGLKHRSPDKADGACIVADFLRRRGVVPAGNTGGGVVLSLEQWNKRAAQINAEDENAYEDADCAFA